MYLQEEDVEDGVEGGVEVASPEDCCVNMTRSFQALKIIIHYKNGIFISFT